MSIRKKGKTLIWVVACLWILAMLTGCGHSGKGKESGAGDATGAGEVLISSGNVTVKAGAEGVTFVSEEFHPFLSGEGYYAQSVTPEGAIWGRDGDGNVAGNLDFPESIDLKTAWSVLVGDDVIYVYGALEGENMPTRVTLYDRKEGTLLGNVSLEGGQLVCIEAGGYLLKRLVENSGKVSLCKIDRDKMVMTEVMTEFPEEMRGIFLQGNDSENLYLFGTESVYRYAFSEKVFYKLFDWTGADLIGSKISFVWKGTGDEIYATSWADAGGLEYYKISPKNTDELPKKKELVVALLSNGSDGNLQKFVTSFNKAQDEWHVTIRTYGTDGDMENGKTRMQADFLGTNPPDLVCLANVSNSEDMAKQGYLMDLRSFLKKSDVLSEEDFYPEVLQAGSYGDLLYTIPYSFNMRTLIIPKKEWSGDAGWTYSEMVEYLRKKEEYRPFRRMLFMKVYLFQDDLDYFYDESGECRFDSEEFKVLLEYMKECGEKENLVPTENRPFNFSQEHISMLARFADLREELPEDYLIMGYPSPDGTPRTVIEGTTELSILSTTKDPEGAWRFMESYLTAEPMDGLWLKTYALYSNRNWMQKIIDQELRLCGEDHEDLLDEEGNVIATMYSRHNIDQECVDAFLEALSHARKPAQGAYDVRVIVYEETAPYFEGQKSLEQTVDAVEKRVKLYLAEQK